MSKNHKKKCFFPELLGTGQVVVLLCQLKSYFMFHISCQHKNKEMCSANCKTKYKRIMPMHSIFSGLEKALLQTCAGTNTSASLQSVDPLRAEIV